MARQRQIARPPADLEAERAQVLELLRHIYESGDDRDLLRRSSHYLQTLTGCEAVGVRLREGNDFPYYETRGFPPQFLLAENSLCTRGPDGKPAVDICGDPVLECMCGNVICGRFDATKPFFTSHGSFWTNCTTELLASTTEADRQGRTRNRCNSQGYESVALLPLRYRDETFGLFQFNDRRPGRFTAARIAHWEQLVDFVAVALAHRRAVQALHASQRKLSQAVKIARLGYWEFDIARNLFTFDDDFYAIFCTSAKQVGGHTLSPERYAELFLYPEDAGLVAAEIQASLATSDPQFSGQLEHRIRYANGQTGYIEVRYLIVKDHQGRTIKTCGVNQDITERKRADATRERLSAAIEQAAEAIVITDPEGTIQYVNPAFERISGYTRAEAIGQNPRVLQSGRHNELYYRQLWETITRGEVWSGHFTNRRKDGTLYEEEGTIAPVFDSARKIVNFVAVKRDVTRELALAAQLQHAQRMELAGTLAAGVAHDFNNVLTAILGYLDLARRNCQALPAVLQDLDGIEQASQAAASITRTLLMFSRKLTPQFSPVHVGPVAQDTIRMLRRLLPAAIQMTLEGADDSSLWIDSDSVQLNQVIMNLAINARDALPAGGQLRLRLARAPAESGAWWQAVDRQHGVVLLTVEDTGVGMTPEVLIRVCEPFFTTKPRGEGTGLGLSVVDGIVAAHGGQMRIESTPGQGTCVTVALPLRPAPETNGKTDLPSGTPLGHGERILLAEDNGQVRAVIAEALRAAGYVCVPAADGVAALSMLTSGAPAPQLAIFDEDMPRKSGTECLAQLRGEFPELPVILISGLISAQAPGAQDQHVEVLRKPFAVADLVRTVGELLRRSANSPPRNAR